VHDKIRDFECSLCDYTASVKASITKHIKTVHNQIYDKKCPEDGCDFINAHPSNLTQHIKEVHLKVRDKKCPHCDYKAARNTHLKTHIERIHVRGGSSTWTGRRTTTDKM
jgi:KRAB domain-containing zinc finger protein